MAICQSSYSFDTNFTQVLLCMHGGGVLMGKGGCVCYDYEGGGGLGKYVAIKP